MSFPADLLSVTLRGMYIRARVLLVAPEALDLDDVVEFALALVELSGVTQGDNFPVDLVASRDTPVVSVYADLQTNPPWP